MTPPLPGSIPSACRVSRSYESAPPSARRLALRLPKLVAEPAQAAARRDHRAQQQVHSRQRVRQRDQRRLRQPAVVGDDDDRRGPCHLHRDSRLGHAGLQRRRGAVDGSGHHRSSSPQSAGLGGLDRDFALNVVPLHHLGELLRLDSAGGAQRLGPLARGVVAHLQQNGVRRVHGNPPGQPVVDIPVHLDELPGLLQHLGLMIAQPQQSRGHIEGIGPVAGDAIDILRAQQFGQSDRLCFGAPVHPDHRRTKWFTGAVQRQQSGRLGTHSHSQHPFRPMLHLRQRPANGLAGCLPPVLRLLLHPPGAKVMQRILRLANGAEVSAKVQKNGLHGTGSGIDSEQQWFHVVLSTAALVGRIEWRDGDHPEPGNGD